MSRKHERLTPKQRREANARRASTASLGWCKALGAPRDAREAASTARRNKATRIAAMEAALERVYAVSREPNNARNCEHV